jgi:hypothetical protein
MVDLTANGAAMATDALQALGDGDLPRSLTQQWARAIESCARDLAPPAASPTTRPEDRR